MKDFLRQSQVLTTFGPGAMVDLPDRAVLIEGLQGWRFSGGREEVQEPRLVAKLRDKLGLPSVRLVKPPLGSGSGSRSGSGRIMSRISRNI